MDTLIANVIDLTEIDETFPLAPENEISRISIVDTLERIFDNNIDAVFLEGPQGSGLTTLLKQFNKNNNFNAIGHFINPADRYTYNIDFIKKNLINQIYFYINKIINADILTPTETLYELRPMLDKALKKNKKYLYFVIDGLGSIPESKREIIYDVLADLPWGKVKFLISGEYELLKNLIPNNSIKSKSHQISYFSLSEAKDFLKDITVNEIEISELYKISLKGLPGKLLQVRRLCIKYGVNNFLSNDIDEKTNLFEIEWKAVQNNDEDKVLLALLSYDDFKYNSDSISKRLGSTSANVEKILKTYSFISITNDSIAFVSEYFRVFASKKLTAYKDKALGLAIDYFVKYPNSDDSIANLPHLFQKAKRYKDLIGMLSIENFATLLQRHQSFSSITEQFDYGINATKEFDKFSINFMRFSLLKSTFREIERYKTFESEIEAYISINQPDEAYKAAISAYLKEDRILLLSELAKQKRENGLVVEPEIIDQIQSLYKQINVKTLGKDGSDLASNLLYSCPDLAIDLIENLAENGSDESIKDRAYVQLSFDIVKAKKKIKNLSTDLELIKSKIKDSDKREHVNAMADLFGDYNSEQIIKRIEKLDSTNKKLFVLENWILNNKEAVGVEEVINKALNLVISNSADEVPSATMLANIATPLPNIKNSTKCRRLIELFDSQKNTINTPTEDFINLQLILAKAVAGYNYSIAKDRFIEIYFRIDEIKDLAVKTNCLAYFWSTLYVSIFKDTINKEEKLVDISFAELNKCLKLLLENTAIHIKILDKVIKTIVSVDFSLLTSYVPLINTESRRDRAYYLMISLCLDSEEVTDIDFVNINKVYALINNRSLKDDIVLKILKKCSDKTIGSLTDIMNIMPYIIETNKINHIAVKCIALAKSIIALYNITSKDKLRNSLIDNLRKIWDSIDVLWYKVELGYSLSSQFSSIYPDMAFDYLGSTIKERENSSFSDSISIPDTYTMSVRLVIRAFAGLIRSNKELNIEIQKISSLIKVIPSFGEQVRLWNFCALAFYNRKNIDNFRKIVREYIKPKLASLGSNENDYKMFVLKEIAPSLFLDHQPTFFDYISHMTIQDRDEAINNTYKYIMTKVLQNEPLESSDNGYNIQYEEAKDVCILIKNLNYDVNIYQSISQLVSCLKRKSLSPVQINEIKRELNAIIDKDLPKIKTGIQHNGFQIACKAILLSLETFNEKKWEEVKLEALDIPNSSDKVFVFCVIAEYMNTKNKKLQIDLLLEAFQIAKGIPSSFERFERYELIVDSLGKLSMVELNKIMTEMTREINKTDENDLNEKHSDFVDLLYQHDPNNIDNYLSYLDNGLVKKNKIKKNIENKIKLLKLRKEATSDFQKVEKFKNKRELITFANNTLAKLNADKMTGKNPEEVFYLIKSASDMPLSESFVLFSLYIESIIKKLERSTSAKNNELLRSIYESTVFSANLVDILSQNNVTKIKNRLKAVNTIVDSSDLHFVDGERDKFETYIRSWIEDNVTNSLYFLDPYFSENDLGFLKLVKEVLTDCEVSILTSKQGGNNRYENNEEVYNRSWQFISSETPPYTSIKIVWSDVNLASPFHNRYLIVPDSHVGLQLGSSFGSIGDFQQTSVNVLTTDEVKNIENNEIRDYLEGSTRMYAGERLKYSLFELS